MSSMTNDEYTSSFLELLRYVPYLKEEKAKVQGFISGLIVAYRDRIEFDEPRSLEVSIQKLKHFYEQSKCKFEPKHDLKRNDKVKGKWPPKRGRPQDASEKENVFPYKRFNTTEKGHGEQQARGGGREPLQCWICGKDHRKRDCTQYQSGSRPQIYSAQEAHTIGDVGHSIPQIYSVVDNIQADHQTSNIEMDGKIVIKLFLF